MSQVALDKVIVAAATRPFPGESCNGDGWRVDWHDGRCRIAIIDGLGHGRAAADASQMAQQALAVHTDLLPEESLRACHAALVSTRGAAISVAAIDPVHERLTYCGVGNAEACLLASGRWERLIAYRGIVGAAFPRLRTFSYALGPEWMLVMYTDGIRSGFQMEGLPDAVHLDPQVLADGILQTWARQADDATILIIRPGQSSPD